MWKKSLNFVFKIFKIFSVFFFNLTYTRCFTSFFSVKVSDLNAFTTNLMCMLRFFSVSLLLSKFLYFCNKPFMGLQQKSVKPFRRLMDINKKNL